MCGLNDGLGTLHLKINQTFLNNVVKLSKVYCSPPTLSNIIISSDKNGFAHSIPHSFAFHMIQYRSTFSHLILVESTTSIFLFALKYVHE